MSPERAYMEKLAADAQRNTIPRPVRTRSISESIQDGHRSAYGLESVLNEINCILSGNGAGDTNPEPSCGVVADADHLASRITGLISMAERAREQIRNTSTSTDPRAGNDFAQPERHVPIDARYD